MRVVKVGGSLFDLPDLSTRLQNWLAANNDLQNILLAGGGNFVDAIRDAQLIHRFDDQTAHRLSIETMSTTAILLSSMLPGAFETVDIDAALASESDTIVFRPAIWLRGETRLQQSWEVTSDTIAAHLADSIDAEELVLMKSVDFDESNDTFTDTCFQKTAQRLSCRFVNLRL